MGSTICKGTAYNKRCQRRIYKRPNQSKKCIVSSKCGAWSNERVGCRAGVTYLRYTVLTSPNKGETAVHWFLSCWCPVVSALQPIAIVSLFLHDFPSVNKDRSLDYLPICLITVKIKNNKKGKKKLLFRETVSKNLLKINRSLETAATWSVSADACKVRTSPIPDVDYLTWLEMPDLLEIRSRWSKVYLLKSLNVVFVLVYCFLWNVSERGKIAIPLWIFSCLQCSPEGKNTWERGRGLRLHAYYARNELWASSKYGGRWRSDTQTKSTKLRGTVRDEGCLDWSYWCYRRVFARRTFVLKGLCYG